MSDVKHTPTPWRVFRTENGLHYMGVGDAEGGGILDAGFGLWRSGPEAEANAEFACRAVNAHEMLVSALQMSLPALEWCQKQWAHSPQQGDGINVLDVVRAALAKAAPLSSKEVEKA